MNTLTIAFFWYVGYWTWLGLLFDREDRFSASDYVVWLFYPVILPLLLMYYVVTEAYGWAMAIAGDIKDKL